MKKLAWFILFLFASVQVIPGVRGFFQDSKVIVFTIDEEKNTDKTISEDLKEKKDYTAYSSLSSQLTDRINTAFHVAEKILPAPSLDPTNPPPNI